MYNYSEEALERIDDKIVQIEAALDLLECKLSSIPEEGLNAGDAQAQPSIVSAESVYVAQSASQSSQGSSVSPPAQSLPAQNADAQKASSQGPAPSGEVKKEEKKASEEEIKDKLRAELYKDEQVKKFASMLKFGVPKGAILSKMQSLGYNPDILTVRC